MDLDYSMYTMSCFGHTRTTQTQLMQYSEDGLNIYTEQNKKQRAKDLNFTQRQVKQLRSPLILVGPSGSGKSTYLKHMTDVFPNTFKFSVSYTTRAPRPGEVHGVNYFYVTREKMEQKIKNNEFIEWFEVHSNIYGTEIKQIQDIIDSGLIPVLDIDIQGTEKFLKHFPTSNTVFILPPSIEILEKRLVGRGTETPEKIAIRLNNAKAEIARGLDEDDKSHLVGYRMINGELEHCKRLFVKLIKAIYKEEGLTMSKQYLDALLARTVFHKVREEAKESKNAICLEKMQTLCLLWDEPDLEEKDYEGWDIQEQQYQIEYGENQAIDLVYHFQLTYPLMNKSTKKKKAGTGRMQFNRILNNYEQAEIFEEHIQDYVDECFVGMNFSILNLGAYQSGKTYQIIGSSMTIKELIDFPKKQTISEEAQEYYGAFPRAIIHIFDQINSIIQDQIIQYGEILQDFELEMSVLEVYNDFMSNLLGSSLDQRKNIIDFTKVSRFVRSPKEALKMLGKALNQVHFDKSDPEYYRSRSHLIYSLNLKQTNLIDKSQITGRITFVDLAQHDQGSQHVEMSPEKMEENNKISQSYYHLDLVVDKLNNKNFQHVPYNNSKLTKCLRDVIGGNSRTISIFCCSRKRANLAQNFKCLQFSSKIQRVYNQPKINYKTFKQLKEEEKKQKEQKKPKTKKGKKGQQQKGQQQQSLAKQKSVIKVNINKSEISTQQPASVATGEDIDINIDQQTEQIDAPSADFEVAPEVEEEQVVAQVVEEQVKEELHSPEPSDSGGEQPEPEVKPEVAEEPLKEVEKSPEPSDSGGEGLQSEGMMKLEESLKPDEMPRQNALVDADDDAQDMDPVDSVSNGSEDIDDVDFLEQQFSNQEDSFDQDDEEQFMANLQEDRVKDPSKSKTIIQPVFMSSQGNLMQSKVFTDDLHLRVKIPKKKLSYAKVYKKIVNQSVFGAYNSKLCLTNQKEKQNISNLINLIDLLKHQMEQDQLKDVVADFVPEFRQKRSVTIMPGSKNF